MAAIAVMAAIAAATTLSLLARPLPRSRIAVVVAGAAIAGVAATGLIVVAGVLGLAVVAVTAVTSPACLRLLRGPLQALSGPAQPTTYRHEAERIAPSRVGLVDTGTSRRRPAPWDPLTVYGLSDQNLCLAWRVSYTALQRPTTADHGRLPEFRAAVLDELQSRQPDAFVRWIDAGARAAGDPNPFFVSRRG